MDTLIFKPDAAQRRRFFAPDSFAHPAKMSAPFLIAIAERMGIEPGMVVLDPMAGSGTTMLLAQRGVNVVLVELEAHFVEPMRRSWAKVQQHGPEMGYALGNVTIIHGDARNLGALLADNIITSPPYEGFTDGGVDGSARRLAAKIASGLVDPKAARALTKGSMVQNPRYTRPQADAVITSPPYGDTFSPREGGEIKPEWSAHREHRGKVNFAYNPDSGANIGNLRGDAYWREQGKVYAECYRVLRPGGLMALVVKGFTRAGQYVDLPQQSLDLCLKLGFQAHDRFRRELWALSFWRVLQKKNHPETWDERLRYEEVLVVRKPDAAGGGVDAVITSPPYEGIMQPDNPNLIGSPAPPGAIRKSPRKASAGTYTRPVDAILTSPPYEGLAVTDLNASVRNGPIGNKSRQSEGRKGGSEASLGFGAKGYTRPAEPAP